MSNAEVKGTKKSATDSIAEAGLAEALEEKVHDFEYRLETPLGEPTAELLEDTTLGKFQLVIACTDVGDLTFTLPLAKREDAGRLIPVKNLHADEDLNVVTSGDDTIDGNRSTAFVSPGGSRLYAVQGEGKWLELFHMAANARGFMYILESDSAGTTVNASTYVKIAGTSTAGRLHQFTMPADNRLMYNGHNARDFEIVISLSADVSIQSLVHFGIAVNGTVDLSTVIDEAFRNANDHAAVPLTWETQLQPNDYLELWALGDKAATLTVDHMNFGVYEL